MRCPTLKELPPPPPGKTGWPWSEESHQLPDKMPDGSPWPKISIVTPSLNQCQFIEETIRSVLLQGYPDLEYIIIDGGSSDNSVDTIKKYENWLAYWVSEQDRGQAHAINKGIEQCSGPIFAWINSDDFYNMDVFVRVANLMYQNGITRRKFIYGNCVEIDKQSNPVRLMKGGPTNRKMIIRFWRGNAIPQPSVFMHKKLIEHDLLNENLQFVMDWELWARLSDKTSLHYFPIDFAYFRFYDHSKSGTDWICFIEEQRQVLRKYFFEKKINIKIFLEYLKWEIRFVYHQKIRNILKICLLKAAGERTYRIIKKLKTKYFPHLSKSSLKSLSGE